LFGVFIGVFIGALGYELVSRSRPDAIEKIRKGVKEAVDNLVGSADEFDPFEEPLAEQEV